MTRIVVVGDLMTDTVARAALPLVKGSDTPAAVPAKMPPSTNRNIRLDNAKALIR